MAETKQKRHIKADKKVISLLSAFALIAALAAFMLSGGNPFAGLENTMGSNAHTEVSGGFKLYSVDVGQGDCTIITCDGESMIVDAGEKGCETDIINLASSLGIDRFDYAVATHAHSDHIGGMKEVLDNIGAETFMYGPVTGEQAEGYYFTRTVEAAEDCDASLSEIYEGYTFSLGSAEVSVIGPVTVDTEEENDLSLVLMVTYGSNKFLLMADAEEQEEKDILASGHDVDADVIKVGHHGSSTSSKEEFLAAVTPEYCLISVGKDNDYGHPNESTLERLSVYTDEIYRTDLCGTVTVTSDGENISVSY